MENVGTHDEDVTETATRVSEYSVVASLDGSLNSLLSGNLVQLRFWLFFFRQTELFISCYPPHLWWRCRKNYSEKVKTTYE